MRNAPTARNALQQFSVNNLHIKTRLIYKDSEQKVDLTKTSSRLATASAPQFM